MRCFNLIIAFFFCGNAVAQHPQQPDTLFRTDTFNYILGTNTIGGNYQFTSASKLVEQANAVHTMGSNILKVSMGRNAPDIYKLTLQENPLTTLGLFNACPEYRQVFAMDFAYIFIWVHTLTGINWKTGINAKQEKMLYDEMFEFASQLLKTYAHTHKTFLIGNWEGDWLLQPPNMRDQPVSQEHISNMTKWFRIRQQAIDDARKVTGAAGVSLYHYIEVNLVLKGIRGEDCVARRILPEVNPDMVSYSSYESIKNRTYTEKKNQLDTVFKFLEAQLKPKAVTPFPRRVFIGEYGYQAFSQRPESFSKQYRETKEIMRISLELGLPFALHWQLYNNEYDANGVSKNMSLINEQGEKTPLYDLHRKYYTAMQEYLADFRKKTNRDPGYNEFREQAVQVLDSL